MPRAGGTVGSTGKLLDELIEVAPCLGVRLQPDDSLSESEAARIYQLASTQVCAAIARDRRLRVSDQHSAL